MSDVVMANDGVEIPIGDLEQTFTYNASNDVTTIALAYRFGTYVQTFTYSGDNVVVISKWEKQP